eukprot:CAMPEP_0175095340 /NCGR_PEP_ID=MMETSP0086_2-20121207/4096_1 /TAXON_ID=136419 /ORGANISM="Unknown Unknown, Strain D1" /LENGTH=201 /DNA_ID=CAMNT_0016368567 /DNA_START=12 /DNA_END=617 /DNA_ORIENTATION=-
MSDNKEEPVPEEQQQQQPQQTVQKPKVLKQADPSKRGPGAKAGAVEAAPEIRRNAKGGIYVNQRELKQAFEFFDADGKGYITLQDLKKRLGVFYQNLSLREYKFLMNNKQELTEQDLYQLLAHNELGNYDPVAEAFKIYDPQETGYVDLEVFKEILQNLGFSDITDQDIATLTETADVDGDGRVSLNDFRRMMDPPKQPSH